MLEENITEPQEEVVDAPVAFDDGLDEILGEATSSLLALDDDENEIAARSDVDSAEEKSEEESTSTSGQERTQRTGPQGNKHSAKNRIAQLTRIAAEANERADASLLERDSIIRDNEMLKTRIKEVEAALRETEYNLKSLRQAPQPQQSSQGFMYGDFDQNGNWVPMQSQQPQSQPQSQSYRDDDPNRPLTYADIERIRHAEREKELAQHENQQKQAAAQERYNNLVKGWSTHLHESRKNGFDPDMVDSMLKTTLREAKESSEKGFKGLAEAVDIIKDLDYPIETLNALRQVPGYKTMTVSEIAKNVTKLNHGLILRKRTHTKAKPSPEMKSGASPAREASSYQEYVRQKVASAKGR